MPSESDKITKEGLNSEIKDLRRRCLETCKWIKNAPTSAASPDVARETLSFIEALGTQVLNSKAAISTDKNLIINQSLAELKANNQEVEKHIAFTRAAIKDVENEIQRLKSLTAIAEEAIEKKPQLDSSKEFQERIDQAKDEFRLLRAELHKLIQSIFKDRSKAVSGICAQLMQKQLDEESEGYIQVTQENALIIEVLKDINIVSENPYNRMYIIIPVVMTYINITSVKLFVKVQNVFGVCKVFACLVVIGGGIYEIAKGNTANLNKGFEGSTTSAGGIALALYSGLWAYDGWNSVTVVTEEIINPGVNVPLSIALGVPLITALYVFMNVAYMTVLTYSEMVSVPAVAVAFGARVLGPASFLIPLGVAIATFGCAMSVQFGVTRVCYTAARGGHMLEVFSYVNMKQMTPAPAVAFQAILTSVFILVGNIKTLIDFASWFLWFFYGMAMVALLVLRKTHRDSPRPYRVPTPVPCFVLLVSIFLSIVPVVHDPSLIYLIAIGFMFVGVAVYTLFVYYRKTPTRLLRKFTFLTQVLFESVPPSNRED